MPHRKDELPEWLREPIDSDPIDSEPDDGEEFPVKPLPNHDPHGLLLFDEHGKCSYDDEKRREVVALYLTYGKPKRVSEISGVPYYIIKNWVKSEWWDTVAQGIRASVESEVRAKLSAVTSFALDEALDRLEHGDVRLDRNGEQHRVPVNAKDSMLIAAMAYDKLRLSLNLPGKITDQGLGKTLADQLSRLSDHMNARVVSEQ